MERAMRFELTTPTLARLCSTPELRPLNHVRGNKRYRLRGGIIVSHFRNATVIFTFVKKADNSWKQKDFLPLCEWNSAPAGARNYGITPK